MDYNDPTGFAEVYSVDTGIKQTVPRGWLDDPILGRTIRLTPTQRELDGTLPARPHESDTVESIDDFADAAGIDLTGATNRVEKVAAIDAAFDRGDDQDGLEDIDPEPVAPDPLAPALAAHTDELPPLVDQNPDDAPDPSVNPDGDTTSSPDQGNTPAQEG